MDNFALSQAFGIAALAIKVGGHIETAYAELLRTNPNPYFNPETPVTAPA
jgi:hypothetical protein